MTEPSIQKCFGVCIREIRNKQGISQEKFALQIEMDRTYYASVESGRRNISLANIEKIANGLGVSLSILFAAIENYRLQGVSNLDKLCQEHSQ